MTFRIGGNGDPFNNKNLGKQHEIKDETAVLPKTTVPVGKSEGAVTPEHIDLGDLQGLDALGYQNMGLYIRRTPNPVGELVEFAHEFNVADVSQSERDAAMAVVTDPNIRFSDDVNREKLMMAMARETVSKDSQARIEQSLKDFDRLV